MVKWIVKVIIRECPLHAIPRIPCISPEMTRHIFFLPFFRIKLYVNNFAF